MSKLDELNPDDFLVSQYDEEANTDFFENPEDENIADWLENGEEEAAFPEEEGEVEDSGEEEEAEEAETEEEEEKETEEVITEDEEVIPSIVEESASQAPDSEQARQILQDWEAELETRYQKLLTPDKALQILSDPEKVLPALLKEVHVAAIRDAATMFQQMIPVATQTNMRQMMEVERNEREFFAEHKDLLPHKKEFDQFFGQYRSLPVNVGRGFTDISKEAAYVFRARKGLVKEGKERPTRIRPAPPPAIGGASSVPTSARQTNPFASLAEEFIQEDI